MRASRLVHLRRLVVSLLPRWARARIRCARLGPAWRRRRDCRYVSAIATSAALDAVKPLAETVSHLMEDLNERTAARVADQETVLGLLSKFEKRGGGDDQAA